MLRFRTGHRTVKLLRRSLLWLAVLVMSCSLISMGGLIWINNSWAVFPDDDPATSFDFSLILETLNGQADFSAIDVDGDGQIPVPGGKLLKGNGTRDDNKHDPIVIVSRPGEIITPNPFNALVVFRVHRAVSSYLDFGHLKVFPDAILPLIIAENITYYSLKATTIYPRGGLFGWP